MPVTPGAEPVPRRFQMQVVAEGADIDVLGHVSNIVYVRWLQQVASEASIDVGWGHGEYQKLGLVFVVRRHEIDYRAPAFAGQEIEMTTWVENWRAASCTRCTEMIRKSDQARVVSAKTTWALVSVDSGRPQRIPEHLLSAFLTVPS